MDNISISFPGVQALKSVNFTTETGISHALVGANGAGKSTLMKVLAGAHDHYTGSIFMNGKEVTIRSPRDAKELGIEVVYQEVDTALVPSLTAAENIMLDYMVNDMGRRQRVVWRDLYRKSGEILGLLNVHLDPKKVVSGMTLAQKQMILIARALYKQINFLILDEPTAPLSNSETEELFRVVRGLLDRGIGIIFISHRLSELKEICSEITILRDGRFVSRDRMSDLDIGTIVERMLGRRFSEHYPKYTVEKGDDLFRVDNLRDEDTVRDVTLRIRKGEIVGLAGLVGAGKSELCKALFGASSVSCDNAEIGARRYRIRSPFDAVRQGVALVPEERRKEGILVQESVTVNLTAASLSNFSNAAGFVQSGREKSTARRVIGDLGIITPGEYQKVKFLSGGNQQKVAVGKWLIAEADIYIFDEPTKGIDVGAKTDIFNLIGRLAEAGKGILYASCELAEIIGITDRVYVMYSGTIVKELVTSETSEEELLFYSTGGQ